jgi:hypothetical protein
MTEVREGEGEREREWHQLVQLCLDEHVNAVLHQLVEVLSHGFLDPFIEIVGLDGGRGGGCGGGFGGGVVREVGS